MNIVFKGSNHTTCGPANACDELYVLHDAEQCVVPIMVQNGIEHTESDWYYKIVDSQQKDGMNCYSVKEKCQYTSSSPTQNKSKNVIKSILRQKYSMSKPDTMKQEVVHPLSTTKNMLESENVNELHGRRKHSVTQNRSQRQVSFSPNVQVVTIPSISNMSWNKRHILWITQEEFMISKQEVATERYEKTMAANKLKQVSSNRSIITECECSMIQFF